MTMGNITMVNGLKVKEVNFCSMFGNLSFSYQEKDMAEANTCIQVTSCGFLEN